MPPPTFSSSLFVRVTHVLFLLSFKSDPANGAITSVELRNDNTLRIAAIAKLGRKLFYFFNEKLEKIKVMVRSNFDEHEISVDKESSPRVWGQRVYAPSERHTYKSNPRSISATPYTRVLASAARFVPPGAVAATTEFGSNIRLFLASVEAQLADAIRGLRIELRINGRSAEHRLVDPCIYRTGEIRSE